jgi:MFS superfamily sulfate permease-like transporter
MAETETGSETKEYLTRITPGLSEQRESDVSYSEHSYEDDDNDISTTCSKEEDSSIMENVIQYNDNPTSLPGGEASNSAEIPSAVGTGTGASSLMSLFPTSPSSRNVENFPTDFMDSAKVPPSSQTNDEKKVFISPTIRPKHHRQNTERISNSKKKTSWLSSDEEDNNAAVFHSNTSDEMSHLLEEMNVKNYNFSSAIPAPSGTKNNSMNSIYHPLHVNDEEEKSEKDVSKRESCVPQCKMSKASMMSSIAGSVVVSLFHIVFCLAQASAIHRPYSGRPVLGVMVRMAAVGPLIAGAMFLYALQGDFAAVCPTVDVFPAPFFAQMAAVVDESLVAAGLEDQDLVFLTTFGLLAAISLILTGMLIIVGTKVKLVNLSAFLPYPVMCGFFSSVGVLLWNLAFTVDTGEKVWDVFSGGDVETIKYCMKHHVGSLFAGAIIIFAGKRNQKLVPLFAIMPIPLVYLGLVLTGKTLKDAQGHGWFWSEDEITVNVSWSNVDAIKWEAPMPFGVIMGILQGKVYFPAVIKGLPIALSMGLIFFIRCSLHAPALRKTSNNLLKWRDDQEKNVDSQRSNGIEEEPWIIGGYQSDIEDNDQSIMTDTNLPMADVFNAYGKILAINGLAGGFACLPSIGVGGTMFKIGAAGALPQYLSLFVLAIFYFTEFTCVEYLPKMTFSSLLFATSIEMVESWFFNSYKKTLVKSEWAVTPIIVVATFLVGSLQSVALGLAISTFLFVGTLNRSGVVKFISNGLTVHSITERNAEDAAWLDQNGDLIQLLVLQSYIFFGNANSCLSYVNSMFEEPPEDVIKNLAFPLPPVPKYLIIDMTMVVGMDTSSVDVFGEIIQLCFKKNCKIFLTGLQPTLKKILSLGGVKPSNDSKSANSILRFPSDIESALCKAEDGLLKSYSQIEEKEMRRSRIRKDAAAGDGFLYALSEIDKQVRTTILYLVCLYGGRCLSRLLSSLQFAA